jgi:hypothetical protein
MSDLNPYQSPSTPRSQWEVQSDVEAVFHEAAQTLAQTKPWVRFLAVVGFLMFAISILGIVGMGIMLAMQPASPDGMMMMLAVLPIAVLVYFIPSLLLWNYASRIADFLIDKSSQALAAAVGAQRSFWKYVGITSAVGIILYMGFFIIAGMLGALR